MRCQQHRPGPLPHGGCVLRGAPIGTQLLLPLADLRVREAVLLLVSVVGVVVGGACGRKWVWY